jgi:MFS family permease
MQVLAICCMSILLVSLDNTIVNVALPTIQRDLDASLPQLQWIVDAYTVVLATLLILSGSIADRIGRKRVFAVGLGLFSVGSLLCSAAPSPGWLIAFRALQGVGGSMLNPVAMSIIRNVFTDSRERAQAIGVWGGVVGISMCRSASSRSCSWRASCPNHARPGRDGSTRLARCWRCSSSPA